MTMAEIDAQKCESDLVDGRHFTIDDKNTWYNFKNVVGPIGNNRSVRVTVAGSKDAHIALGETTQKNAD